MRTRLSWTWSLILLANAGWVWAENPTRDPQGGDHAPVFDIPRIEHIAIDGHADDWGDGGLKVNMLCPMDGQPRPPSDIDARVRLAWDDRGVLVLAIVKDDCFVEDDNLNTLWQRDGLEIFLADKRGGARLMQAVIAPGVDGQHNELRYKLHDHRKDKTEKIDLGITAARGKTDGGYVMEILLPWSNIGVKPATGVEVGFTVFVNDMDKEGRLGNLAWYPGVGVPMDPMKTYSLRLSDKAGEPVNAAARDGGDGMKAIRVTVAAAKELAGRKASLEADGKTIASGELKEDAGWATVELTGRLPPFFVQYKVLDVLLDGRIVESLTMRNVEALRWNALHSLDIALDRYILTSSALPGWRFEDAKQAENILDGRTVAVSFYDAGLNEVKTADKTGVYTAAVEFHRPGQTPIAHSYHTLLRLPDGTDLSAVQLAPTPQLPRELGIGDELARRYTKMLANLNTFLDSGPTFKGRVLDTEVRCQQLLGIELRWGRQGQAGRNAANLAPMPIADSLQRSDIAAIVFGWLGQLEAGKVTRGKTKTDPKTWNMYLIQDLRRKLGNPIRYEYHTQMPPDLDKTKKYPVIISLHGQNGGNGDVADVWCPAKKFLKNNPDFPFILIAPVSRNTWHLPPLDDLYDEVLAKYPADPDRVYLTGFSMGGFASWAWMVEHPDRFAAVAPVCGLGSPDEAPLFKEVPIWVFHGEKDTAVPPTGNHAMVDALEKVGGRVRSTFYPDVSHDSWDHAYKTPELYQWMLRQERGKPQQPPSPQQ